MSIVSPRTPRSCPLCRSDDVVDEGPTLHPYPYQVAGVPIDLGDENYRLAACRSCGFKYKDPKIPSDRLLACYAKASQSHWGEDPDPAVRMFDRWIDVLARHAPGRRILDIGCFNGALLAALGPDWERCGVEPCREAAALAAQRGVRILGERLDDLDPQRQFDAIIAIDVVEHIVEPLPFVRAVAAHLAPNGVFILVTGDTDAPTWRLHGSRYWYCSLVEHVSFYNKSCLNRLASESGLRSVEHARTRHERAPVVSRAIEAAKNLAYAAGNRVNGLGLAPLKRLFVDRRAPGWSSAADHLVHVMKRD